MSDPPLENSLKVYRALNDLTQADLAGLAGITRASVNAIEGGRMVPSVLLALKLARALGATVDDLFRLEGPTGEPGSDEHTRMPPATPRPTWKIG